MKKIAVITGAGLSAESGISTFRDANGLWENHDIMEVASIDGWHKNPDLVNSFYNQRRKQLKEVHPNSGHKALVELESKFEVNIITQNVDNLHERAGSKQILHLHGELNKVRSSINTNEIYTWTEDLDTSDTDSEGYPLRPHIVWFGEQVPLIETAAKIVQEADILIIVGTSLQVYPAAGLSQYRKPNVPMYVIDPNPELHKLIDKDALFIQEVATLGLTKLVDKILSEDHI